MDQETKDAFRSCIGLMVVGVFYRLPNENAKPPRPEDDCVMVFSDQSALIYGAGGSIQKLAIAPNEAVYAVQAELEATKAELEIAKATIGDMKKPKGAGADVEAIP